MADDLTQPIRVSPDGHFLTQPDGEPFFWLADTAWELLHRLNREETERYFEDRSPRSMSCWPLRCHASCCARPLSTMIDAHAFDAVAEEAAEKGVPLISFNVDGGRTPNARLATVGQNM